MTFGPTDESPALERLIARPRDRFARESWGRLALLASRDERGGDVFADLFGPDAVDELIADRGLRAPFLRMARDGATLGDSAFTSGGGIGAGVTDQVNDDQVRRLFADGSTIVLQGLHRTWRPIKEFTAALAAELGHPIQVNAYVTPPQNQGFSPHYDVHDVFVLQISGGKEWIVHEPVWPAPLRDQPWGRMQDRVAEAATAEPALQTTLRPGDCLYLPRGYIHSARALGETTIHLTVGVHPWTRRHLAEAMLDAARAALGDDPEARTSLPLGVDVGEPGALAEDADAVRSALLRALDGVTPDALAASLLGKSRASQRPASIGPLAQVHAADSLTPDTPLALRPHLLAELVDGPDGVGVRSRAGRFTLPPSCRPALERLLAGETVTVADLAPDVAEAAAAARTCLIEGLAVVP